MSVLITGAGRGIGLGLAAHYAAAGMPVIGTHRGAAPAPLAGVTWQRAEMTDPESLRALADALAGRPLSLLICNAGVYPDRGQQLDTGYPPQMWADAFATNVTGVFLAIQALPYDGVAMALDWEHAPHEILVSDLRTLQWYYQDGVTGQWSQQWDAARKYYPARVRLQLADAEGEWPELVFALPRAR